VVFVFFHDSCASVRIRFPAGTFRARARDLIGGEAVSPIATARGEEYHLICPGWGVMLLVYDV
jgi:hypothetical protein